MNETDPYEAKRRELLESGRQALRDDPAAQHELAQFDAEMQRRKAESVLSNAWTYLPVPCPNCGRRRLVVEVLCGGDSPWVRRVLCEKCDGGWPDGLEIRADLAAQPLLIGLFNKLPHVDAPTVPQEIQDWLIAATALLGFVFKVEAVIGPWEAT